MKALVVSALGPDFSGCAVQDVSMPEPRAGEARVQVVAASVNFPDLLMTRGEYQFKPPLPFTPGLDFAGVIDAVGEGVDPTKIGEPVVGGSKTGGFGQFVSVPAASLRRKPDSLSFAQAAAYPAAYLTAYVALVRRARLERGEWVLVHGASGGVGLACVDLARHLGARVIATGSSPDKLALVAAEYGPETVIDVRQGFRERVKELTGGRGADIVYDPVGGDVFDESVRCIAFDGRLLVIGFTSGRIPSVSVNMPLIKGFSVMGVRAGEYGRQFPQRGIENIAAIDALAASGAIRPRVHAEYPLVEWRDAFEMLANRKVVGKVIIRPDL